MCDCTGRNKRVVGARSRLATRRAQRSRYGSKCPCAISVERQDVEIRLGLLQVLLPSTALSIVVGDVWTYGQLSQCDRADHRFIGKLGWVRQLTQKDHRRGIQHPPALGLRHSDGSMRLSISRRRASGSTGGRFLRRRISSAGPALERGNGRSSATGVPSRVMTMRSPCSTRRRTSPPLLRNSRTVTASTYEVYHR